MIKQLGKIRHKLLVKPEVFTIDERSLLGSSPNEKNFITNHESRGGDVYSALLS
ncbi:hypothetical protein H6G35_08050 [Aulosira sp. FACHB-113]|uniref:hypothetical protein n=1 Tax=Tolypothrix tenuis TaxID=457083 RepID=UPI001686D4A0|nr:hypothetical protein [Aulosira sp. FACHB-113]